MHRRQPCLAHLIRTARGLSENRLAELATWRAWAFKELQCLCAMAKAPPTGGAWQAWYAWLCPLIERYHERQDDAGRLARHLQREMAPLWAFLCEHGVNATNNRAEILVHRGWR
jgi:transposase